VKPQLSFKRFLTRHWRFLTRNNLQVHIQVQYVAMTLQTS